FLPGLHLVFHHKLIPERLLIQVVRKNYLVREICFLLETAQAKASVSKGPLCQMKRLNALPIMHDPSPSHNMCLNKNSYWNKFIPMKMKTNYWKRPFIML